MALSDIVPINRKEEFLQAIADKSGAPVPVTRIEEFLKRISESSSLPEVTSEDNGDFLAVVDGEWSKAPAPSSLPPYTSADKGKVLTVGEGSESVEPKWEKGGGWPIIDYESYEARTETVSGQSFDSSQDDILIPLPGGAQPMSIQAGCYVFSDSIPQNVPFAFNWGRGVDLPASFSNITLTNATTTGGFYVSTGNVYFGRTGDGIAYGIISSDAVLGYARTT